MKINLKKLGLLLGVGMMFSLQSCTDFLEPEIYSEYDRNEFESSESAFDAKLGDVYVNLQREYGYVYREGHWSLQENTTDECIVPTRYLGDWYDGGVFWDLHNHRYTSKTREISANGQSGANAWGFAYRGISQCNSMMKWMRSIDLDVKRPADMAELYILRAWYHYILMDNFGNIPFTSSLAENGYEAVQNTRPEVFDSIMTDLTKYVPQASEVKIYSRVNKYVGWMVLSKMYLNAEAWGVVGKAKFAPNAQECYEKAAAYADSVITKGGYSLETNYFDNFKVENQGSKENIWCVFYDASFSKGMQFHMMTMHYASQNSYGLKEQPWNGYCTSHRVLGLYGPGDTRINSWERGQQYDKSGSKIEVDVSIDSLTYVTMPEYVRKPADWPQSLAEFERDTIVVKDKKGNPIKDSLVYATKTLKFPAYFTDTVTTITNIKDYKLYNIFEGARFVKFQVQEGVGAHMSNDFPIYRLADAYLMKAEALMRLNGGQANAEALEAANMVRTRSGAPAYGSLDLDELCNERCRELMWEGHRRQDLIRFGRYTGKNSVQNESDPANLWILKYQQVEIDKKAKDPIAGYDVDPNAQIPFETPDYMKIFPLPSFYVDNGNPQNPGYEE